MSDPGHPLPSASPGQRERWRRVRAIFDALADRTEAERLELLGALEGPDLELRPEVEALLASSENAPDFLEVPALAAAGDLPEFHAALPRRIGPYEIVSELGAGGMGTVFLARRSDEEYRREVAIKLIQRGMNTDFLLRRFRTERQILAALDHSNIARLFDGGSTEEGLPYFVMEYIDGQDLLSYCDSRELSIADRLRLFRQICSAVAYAHQRLVVHRDIKPANILVTAEGVPKLLDFGLAKLLDPEHAGPAAERTATAVRIFTPEYASPEQVRGEPVTTASDVYSLGVVLYRLLAGASPYRVASRSPEEVSRAVCEQEPTRPSAAAAATGGLPRGGRQLRGDLDTIVLKALRKEPDRRYTSAEQLSEDLRRYLERLPVKARKGSLRYQAGKFARRHKSAMGAVVLILLSLVGGIVVSLREARIARTERARAERRFQEVRQLANSYLFEFYDSIRGLAGSTAARELVARRALEYLDRLSEEARGDASLSRELALAYRKLGETYGGILEGNLGDTARARSSHAKSVALLESLVRANPSDGADRIELAQSELALSQSLIAGGEGSQAVEAASRAVGIDAELVAANPADRERRRRLAIAERHLAGALGWNGQNEAAMAAIDRSTRALERLAAEDPSNASVRRDLGHSYQWRLHLLAGTGNRQAAIESYRNALRIQEALCAASPSDSSLARELAFTHSDMGYFLDRMEEYAGAIDSYRRSLEIREPLAAADPANAEARLNLASAENDLGWALARTGRTDEGLAQLSRAVPTVEIIVHSDPANSRALVLLAAIYDSVGTAHQAASRCAEARAWLSKSIRVYERIGQQGKLTPFLGKLLEGAREKRLACEHDPTAEAPRG